MRPVGRVLGIFLSIVAVALLGTLLIATIYWTLFDPKWIAFLGGVLVAALLASASRASRAEWRLARRARQVTRLRARLETEATRARAATDAFGAAEEKIRVLGNAMRPPMFFIDREARCHLHNTAAALELRRAHEAIDGRPLSEAVGGEMFAAMQPHVAEALAGRDAVHALDWPGLPQGTVIEASYTAYPRNTPDPTGVFILLNRRFGAVAPTTADANDLAYLNAMSVNPADWDEPRAKLARALKENSFLLLAQPIAPLLDPGAPRCAEILLRLKEEEDNLLPPGSFFPIAERYGMMEELDRWVVRELINACAEKRRGGETDDIAVYCVNLSRPAIHSHGFARFVQKQLLDRGFDGGRLCFEVAEHDIEPNRGEVSRLMSMLKPFGCRFSVDGFGSATGSFACLKDLAFDYLKIDGVVVQNLQRDPGSQAKLRAIVAVCGRAGIRSIAEFVEDDQTLAWLRAAGVDYVQGFGVARPAPLRRGGATAATLAAAA